jgi:hypothetical protein
MKAKNRGTATSRNAKHRGIVAEKIVKLRLCRGKFFENCGFFAAYLPNIAILSRLKVSLEVK